MADRQTDGRRLFSLARLGPLLAVLVLMGVLAACGSSKEAADQEPTTIEVENQKLGDIVVYAVQGGAQRFRLGRVGLASTEVLTIPRALVTGPTRLRFLAVPLGGGGTIGREITVYPGDQVSLVVTR